MKVFFLAILEFYCILLIFVGIYVMIGPIEISNSAGVDFIYGFLISLAAMYLWYTYFYVKRANRKKAIQEDNTLELGNILTENGIKYISKKVNIASCQDLFIDDTNKRWGIINFSRTNKANTYFFSSYDKLTSYSVDTEKELNIQGHAGSVFVGAMVFGSTGAMMGNSRSKKISEKTILTSINIILNDLTTPNITVHCTSKTVANEVISILEFIKNNK